MTAVTLHQDPRDGRPWHYVRQYGSRNRFERLDLTTTT